MIYYLQHIDIEGPGTLGEFFNAQGFQSKTVELYNNDPLPKNFNEIQAVVILGGPMNVDENGAYPFLKQEKEFIRELIQRDILTIGLCLGAQLIAKSAGSRVYQAPVHEIGFFDIMLTEQGLKDPLFNGVEQTNQFFQWHEDTFDVPESGILLASGLNCPNQIFRLGTKVYGFQCHMEIRQADALAWVQRYVSDPQECLVMKDRLTREFELNQENLCQTAERTYNNLLKLM